MFEDRAKWAGEPRSPGESTAMSTPGGPPPRVRSVTVLCAGTRKHRDQGTAAR
jgi:hypothetical protein